MQIISSKRLLFQEIEYTDETVDGVKTGRRVHNVKNKIIVNADTRPQIVPDWVKDDELFSVCVDDGSVMEITVNQTPRKALAGVSDGPANKQEATPVATFVGDAAKEPAQQGGWATGNTGAGLDTK